MKKLFLGASVLFILALTFSLAGPASAANSWAVGNLVGLCGGTPIHIGSGDSYPIHTVVPEDNWAVKVIDGPRFVDGATWWDTSRYAAGDPSGGTGWVKESEADGCFSDGGGGNGDPGGSDDDIQHVDGVYPDDDNHPIDPARQPDYASVFTWPIGISSLQDSNYHSTFYNFGVRIGYNPSTTDPVCKTGSLDEDGYFNVDGRYVGHTGKDMAFNDHMFGPYPTSENPEVYAIGEGKVIDVKYNQGGYGTHIIILHRVDDSARGGSQYRVWSLYAHLDKDSVRVAPNQIVHRGDPIARYDSSGNWGQRSHLHFEIRKAENTSACVFENSEVVDQSEVSDWYHDPIAFIRNRYSPANQPDPIQVRAQDVATASGGQLIDSQSNTIGQGQKQGPFQFFVDLWERVIVFLNFRNSQINISIYRPDGTLYRTVAATGPVSIEIDDPMPGAWTYTVEAVQIPEDNYPWAVAVAGSNQFLEDTGEIEDEISLVPTRSDLTSPSTSFLADPSSPNGSNGWYKTPVQINLTSADNSGGVGGVVTMLSLDGGHYYYEYIGPVTLATEGLNPIAFYSFDGVGNTEAVQYATIKIDLTSPVVDASIDQPEYTRVQPFIVHYSGYDPEPGSGLTTLTGVFNGQPASDGEIIDIFWLPLGQYTLVATGEDYAGWVTADSETISLVASIPGLQQTVSRLCSEKYITKQGSCTSLQQKLNSALAAQQRGQTKAAVNVLLAFQNELKAQKGKAVMLDAYNLLMMDSNYVIQVLRR